MFKLRLILINHGLIHKQNLILRSPYYYFRINIAFTKDNIALINRINACKTYLSWFICIPKQAFFLLIDEEGISTAVKMQRLSNYEISKPRKSDCRVAYW